MGGEGSIAGMIISLRNNANIMVVKNISTKIILTLPTKQK